MDWACWVLLALQQQEQEEEGLGQVVTWGPLLALAQPEHFRQSSTAWLRIQKIQFGITVHSPNSAIQSARCSSMTL